MNSAPSNPVVSVAEPVDRRAWLVLALLVASTFLNYFDRQILSVVKPMIKGEFGLTDSHYSLLVSVFMAAYVVMYPIGGRLVDTYGSRRCMLVFVSVWSLATVFTGFAGGLAHLVICRVVLGLAEPGNYPAALRASALWFSPARRGFATSMFSAGSAIGAIVAPPLIAWIAVKHGWRAAFLIPGAAGAIWLVAWWFIYRDPAVVAPAVGAGAAVAPVARPAWGEIMRSRVLWGLVLARLISDPVWYFLLFWFPGYVQERMGLSIGQAGAVGWIPFLVADVGGIGAAAFSDRLVRRGMAPTRARITVLFGVACLAPLAMALGFLTAHLALTIAIFSVLAFVCTTWLFTMAALIADAAPRAAIGTVHGISGAFGATGGLIFNACIGPVVDRTGYVPVFIVAGGLHLLAS
ncbi:MAG: MFS transporter, partial [Burkholderiales bacterium]|nr:MFS transporter [Opitutaceae bacterium]